MVVRVQHVEGPLLETHCPTVRDLRVVWEEEVDGLFVPVRDNVFPPLPPRGGETSDPRGVVCGSARWQWASSHGKVPESRPKGPHCGTGP